MVTFKYGILDTLRWYDTINSEVKQNELRSKPVDLVMRNSIPIRIRSWRHCLCIGTEFKTMRYYLKADIKPHTKIVTVL